MSTIVSENFDGLTPPALPSGWTFDTGFKTVTSTFHSSPNALQNSVQFGATALVGYYNTKDGNGGNVSVQASVLSVTNVSQAQCRLIARGANLSPFDTGHPICYFALYDLGSSGVGLALYKNVSSGASAQLGSAISSASFTTNTYYLMILKCLVNTISVSVQRYSDSNWLKSDGTWQSAQTTAISVTDTSIPPLQGYVGLAGYGSGLNYAFDDFLAQTVNPALAPSTCTVTSVSATAQTVACAACIGGTPTFTYQYQRASDSAGSPGSWSNVGSAQSGLAVGATPAPFADSGLTAGAIYWYRCQITDSAVPTPATVNTPAARLSHNFYVSPSGSDTNTGIDPSLAWQTISHVNGATFVAGDTLNFKGGNTFSGSVLISGTTGTQASPFVVTSYGTGNATISCGNSYGVRLLNCAYTTISNLVIVGSGVTSSGVTTSTNAGIEVINNATFGTLGGPTITGNDISQTYAGVEVRGYATAYNSAFGSGFTGTVITNNIGHELAAFGCNVRTVPLQDGSGNPITWDQFSLVTTAMTASNNFTIFKGLAHTAFQDNCQWYHIYGDASAINPYWYGNGTVFRNCSNSTIQRTVAHDNGAVGSSNAGIWMQECNTCTIQFCEVYNQRVPGSAADGDGFDFDGGTVNCLMQYNYSHNNGGSGFLHGPYTNSAIPSGCTFRFNISENDGRFAPGYGGFYPYGGVTNAIWHNNTVYADNAPAFADHGMGAGCKIYNNLFYTTGSQLLLSGNFTGALLDGNLYWAAGSFSITYNGTNYTTFAAYQSASGQDTNGINANPLLVNPGGGTVQLPTSQPAFLTAYDLAANSPAVGAGLDLKVLFGIDPGSIDFHGYPNRG